MQRNSNDRQFMISSLIKEYGMHFLFCLATAFYACMVEIGTYQVDKDTYFWTACSITLVYILYIRKAHIFNLSIASFVLVYASSVIFYLYNHRGDWGPVYQEVLIRKYIAYGIFIIVFADILSRDKVLDCRHINIRSYATVIVLGLAFALEPEYACVVICPMLAVFLAQIPNEVWKKIEISLSCGLAISVFGIMLYSIIRYPDYYLGGRFFGITGIAQNGMLCGLGIISTAYLLYRNYKDLKSKVVYIALTAMIVFLVYMSVIIGSRSGILATIVSVVGILYVSTQNRKRVICGTIVLVVLCAVFVSIYVYLGMQRLSKGESVSQGIMSISYINEYLSGDEIEPWGFIGKEHRLVNTIDHISSGRLSIWFAFWKNSTLFGTNEIGCLVSEERYFNQAHNSFVDWIVRFGRIEGTILCIWFLGQLLTIVKRARCGHNMFLCTIAFFCLSFWMTDFQTLSTTSSFVLLILMGQLFNQGEGEAKEILQKGA